jgi:hypothetical protein
LWAKLSGFGLAVDQLNGFSRFGGIDNRNAAILAARGASRMLAIRQRVIAAASHGSES